MYYKNKCPKLPVTNVFSSTFLMHITIPCTENVKKSSKISYLYFNICMELAQGQPEYGKPEIPCIIDISRYNKVHLVT